jgi:gluconate 5-dehydrogenase
MSIKLFDLTGKVALVTGSNRGLGFSMAKGLAAAGAHVVVNGRSQEGLDEAIKRLKAEGLTASGAIFDVTKPKEIQAAVKKIEDTVGPIDILVNNAGINKRAPLHEMEEGMWREVLDTNLSGAHFTTRAIVNGMIQRKAVKIVNVCSLTSEVARPTVAPYAAAKGALKMLTKAMAVEWAQFNIQANGIGPGYFATDLNKPLMADEKFDSWIRNRTPAKRWGQPDELIGTCIFLASRASDFMTGQIVYVDGGVLASL